MASNCTMPTVHRHFLCLLLSCTLVHLCSFSTHGRRILHQPFVPVASIPSSESPSSSLPQQALNDKPKFPSSNSQPTAVLNTPFFPSISFSSPPLLPSSTPTPSPPAPPTALSSVVTIPANISSLVLPQSSSPRKSVSPKLLAFTALAASISLIFVAILVLFYRRRNHRRFSSGNGKASRSDNLRLYPANSVTSDGGHKPLRGGGASDTTSSEFLYMMNPGGGVGDESNNINTDSETVKVGSPELLPLPPLPRRNVIVSTANEEEDEFYSPRASSSSGEHETSFHAIEIENIGSPGNAASLTSSYPSSNSASPATPRSTFDISTSPPMNLSLHPPVESSSKETSPKVAPPPPPPLPPPNVPLASQGPPLLITPSRPIVFQNTPPLLSPHGQAQSVDGVESCDDMVRPKLKPLHWDKVRARSDGAMVWDQVNSTSFKLNEEMIESLFVVNGSNLATKDNLGRALSLPIQQNQVLDPKKSQNIAILLKALNVTVDEVCEALLEGNADTLGTEFLESLLKMAPTKAEECRIRDFKDESPFKLGPAERFLRAIVNVPFAFKRVNAMLYIANFDSELEYLKRSFETLVVACEELRNSRMFLKLLEAVLRSGNRMNVGTNRGDARAFKLDTLLKLVEIKGGDGKTTLLHFVVQEIIRSEGENQSHHPITPPQSALRDDLEFRKRGLQVVSGLSSELATVKKAAALDSDVLSSEVGKLSRGVSKVKEVLELMEQPSWEESSRCGRKFCESMDAFLQKAEEEIVSIEVKEKAALCCVKDLTADFHGNSAREAHPLRIFTVVSDFLRTLDRVCREVGKINERAIMSSGRTFSNPPPLPF